MRISNYPTDTLTGDELILATDVNTSTQEYKTVNFSVDTLKTFLVGTDDTNEFTNITLGGSLKFEGATADAYETTLGVVDPTADRVINLPNVAGTLPVLAAASTTAITSTPEELNILDGVTATATEINALDGITSTVAELNILDGVTATATELNTLDGVNSTLTAAELNVLDGYTGSVTELNYLDTLHATGVTDTEFDYLDITTLGTVEASKVVTADANGDITVPTDKGIITAGNLLIKGSSETLAKFTDDGSCELYHNDSKKVETTADGIKITNGSAGAKTIELRADDNTPSNVTGLISWENTNTQGSDDTQGHILISNSGSAGVLGGNMQFATRKENNANLNYASFDAAGLFTVPSLAIDSITITATSDELNILDASAGNTAAASDMATSSGAITSNNYKISHTLTLDGSFADDAELADIVVTNNKVLATSVVVANSSAPCQVDVHTVAVGSFKVRVKNISGGALSDDSTMIINYRVI